MTDFHVYHPLPWQRALGYSEQSEIKPGIPRCAASVHEARGFGSHQCERVGKSEITVNGKIAWTCAIHHPDAAKARQDKSAAKYNKEMEARLMRYAAPRYAAALQLIADGHNDPRMVAREALARK